MTTTPLSPIADAPELVGGAVAARADAEDLTRQFRTGPTGAISFDDLLHASCAGGAAAVFARKHHLARLQPYRRIRRVLSRGRAGLPADTADRRRDSQHLSRAAGGASAVAGLGFQGLESSSAVDVHADDAAISVNFWITPTSANLRPGRGGLGCLPEAPPPDWEIKDYDSRPAAYCSIFGTKRRRITERALSREPGRVVRIPPFPLSPTQPSFSPRYENHRINVTFLFGRHAP